MNIEFDDVRHEVPIPSDSGPSTVLDFRLYSEQIGIEVKYTSLSNKDKKVEDDLIVDKKKYRGHPRCKILYCFIYNPGGFLRYKDPLIRSLTEVEDDFEVRVIIRP